MLKHFICSLSILVSLTACSSIPTSSNFNSPQNLLFTKKELNTIPLHVQRDDKLCKDEDKEEQNCPIKFFIDDFKAGDFYINNSTTYYLKENEYKITIKDCALKCDIYHTKIQISNQLPIINITLSRDENDKPFIILK